MYSANDVLMMLKKASFEAWYNEGGNFDAWISRDESAPTDGEIVAELNVLLANAKRVAKAIKGH